MSILFLILIILVSIILALIVLVQNPKGGGLAGSLAGISNQFMGVKQTTDVLEKGTWICGSIIAILCISSTFFISGATTNSVDASVNKAKGAPVQQQAPPPATPAPNNAVPLTPLPDTNK